MTKHFKLNQFLITTLINHNLYLGYSRSQLNNKMAYDLFGLRNKIDIHNLNHTFLCIRKIINICNSIWYNFSTVWLVAPRNLYIRKLFNNFFFKDKWYLRKNILFWTRPWLPGFFKNPLGFLKYRFVLKYPAAIFFLGETNNKDRIKETRMRGILTFNLVDSNGLKTNIEYPINSNETTSLSHLYYSKLLFSTLSFQKKINKKDFITF